MDNKALKQVFQSLHAKIIRKVDPDSATDELFAKAVISKDDYRELYRVPDLKARCRNLLTLLHDSSHPETFIHLRLALLDEYPEIVDEIDEQLTSLTTHQLQLQQLQLSHSEDGKLLLAACN